MACRLLREILLVDDNSQRLHLGQPLDDYLVAYPKVRLLRLGSRHGLVRARLVAVKQAQAPVIVFLDSHVECNKGWLEPLLDIIQKSQGFFYSSILNNIERFQRIFKCC